MFGHKQTAAFKVRVASQTWNKCCVLNLQAENVGPDSRGWVKEEGKLSYGKCVCGLKQTEKTRSYFSLT